MEVRAMEEAIAGETAMPPEKMRSATPLVDRRTSIKEEAKTLTKGSVEEDWQGIVITDPAFYLKDDDERE